MLHLTEKSIYVEFLTGVKSDNDILVPYFIDKEKDATKTSS
jgi:hypothetical protein